jgi:hypothetical protein
MRFAEAWGQNTGASGGAAEETFGRAMPGEAPARDKATVPTMAVVHGCMTVLRP